MQCSPDNTTYPLGHISTPTFLCHLEAMLISAATSKPATTKEILAFQKQDVKRDAANTVFVCDISGSMGPQQYAGFSRLTQTSKSKIALLKQALTFVIKMYSQVDGFGVVTFANEAHTVAPCCPLPSDGKTRETLSSTINALAHGGSTNLDEGLQRGLDLLEAANGEEKGDHKVRNNLVLLTDGIANVGAHQAGDILANLAKHPMGASTTIYAMGIGSDVNQDLLQTLAVKYGGKMYGITKEEDIPAAFGDCMGGLISTVFASSTVTISSPYPIHDQSNMPHDQPDAHQLVYNLGPMTAEEKRDILFKLSIPAKESKSPLEEEEVVLVQFEGQDVWASEIHRQSVYASVHFDGDSLGPKVPLVHLHNMRVQVANKIDQLAHLDDVVKRNLVYSALEQDQRALKQLTEWKDVSPLYDELLETLDNILQYRTGFFCGNARMFCRQVSAALHTQRAVSSGDISLAAHQKRAGLGGGFPLPHIPLRRARAFGDFKDELHCTLGRTTSSADITLRQSSTAVPPPLTTDTNGPPTLRAVLGVDEEIDDSDSPLPLPAPIRRSSSHYCTTMQTDMADLFAQQQ